MAKKLQYKLTIKNGDYKYVAGKNGQYEYKTVDLVDNFDNLGDALLAFLEHAQDDYNDEAVTLTFTPKKRKDS